MRSPPLALVALVLLVLLAASCGGRRGHRRSDAGLPPGDAGAVDAGVPLDGAAPPDGAHRSDGALPTDAGPGPLDAAPRDAGPAPTDAGPAGDRIEAIQRGLIAEGTPVTVRSVVVTGLYFTGLWVQDPTVAGPYAGIRVYVGAAPAVAVGDRVDVRGTVLEYFGDTEIDGATVTRLGSGTPLAPRPITVAEAVTEPWEGVLVRLTDVTTTTSSYDCSVDDPGCSDARLWEARSPSASVVVFDFLYRDADWLSRVGSTSVAGVMGWRYDRRRIMPRGSADFAP